MTKCTEARKLLREIVNAKPSRLKAVMYAIDTFLSQPVPTCDVREAVLVGALRATLAYVKDADGHAEPGEGCSLCTATDIIDKALADTSPAAAALLAQGEEYRRQLGLVELVRDAYKGHHAAFHGDCNIDGPKMPPLRRARAALAPGEEKE